MGTSRLQSECRAWLAARTSHPFKENHRPGWLISGLGERCELDFYVERLHLGIEIQGEQHYRFIPHFHRTYDGFLAQRRRDEFKSIICRAEGVKLFLIHATEDLLPVAHYIEAFSFKPERTGEDPALRRIKLIDLNFYRRWTHHAQTIDYLKKQIGQVTDDHLRTDLTSHIERREKSLAQLVTSHQSSVRRAYKHTREVGEGEPGYGQHEAVRLYEEITGYRPGRVHQRDIAITVSDCNAFRRILEKYVAANRPVERVQWPLYWYMRLPPTPDSSPGATRL